MPDIFMHFIFRRWFTQTAPAPRPPVQPEQPAAERKRVWA
jgi:hypothetical protein